MRRSQEAGPNADEMDPQTQKQLQLLRESYSNTAAFVADLLSDRMLQKQARLICHCLKPLHEEYQADLKAHDQGQESVLYWHGDRASGHYYKGMVLKTLGLLHDTSIITLLDLRPHPGLPSQVKDSQDPVVAQELKLIQQYYNFIVELSANRCWSQSFWTLLMPYSIAGLYASDVVDRRRCQVLCTRMAEALLKLEDLMAKAPNNSDLRGLRDSLGTADWPLLREVLVLGLKTNWDPTNDEMRLLVFTLFAGPGSTKDSLESCFNWLKDSVKVNKSKKMHPFTKFFYTMANPYVKHAGVEPIRPTMSDFQQLLDEGFRDSEVTQHHVFGYTKTPLGKDFPRLNQLIANAKIRKAGFHSNRNAAAASAFMLHDSVNNFIHAPECWPGRVTGA